MSPSLGSGFDSFGGGIDEEGHEADASVPMDDGDEADMDNVRKLGMIWVRERGTVDIMPWEGQLVNDVLEVLDRQVRW